MAPKHAQVRPTRSDKRRSAAANTAQGRVPASAGIPGSQSAASLSGAAAFSRNGAKYVARNAGMSRGKKIALGILIAVLLLIIAAGSALAWYIHSLDETLSGGKSDEEISAINEALSARSMSDAFYVMMIGSDARADDASMGARSDTNIVARIDPKTNTVSMLSIPRDTAIYMEKHGTVKFNAAYAFGGTAETIKQAKQLLNVPISQYVEINFDGLINLVDTLGGVDVDVARKINDPDAGDIIIPAGRQHLNGEAALVFARSRAYADGDYTRASNQRKLIQAIIHKIQHLGITEIPGAISAAAKCVTTNMKVSDIISLALQLREKGETTIYSAGVPSLPTPYHGASYIFADMQALAKTLELFNTGQDPSGIVTHRSPAQLIAEYEQAHNIKSSAGSKGSQRQSAVVSDDDYDAKINQQVRKSRNTLHVVDPQSDLNAPNGQAASSRSRGSSSNHSQSHERKKSSSSSTEQKKSDHHANSGAGQSDRAASSSGTSKSNQQSGAQQGKQGSQADRAA